MHHSPYTRYNNHNLITINHSHSQQTPSYIHNKQVVEAKSNQHNLYTPARLLQLIQHPINPLPSPRQILIHGPIDMSRLELMMQVDEFLCALEITVTLPLLLLLGCCA